MMKEGVRLEAERKLKRKKEGSRMKCIIPSGKIACGISAPVRQVVLSPSRRRLVVDGWVERRNVGG